MTKRHRDAIGIQMGAVNPTAIINTIQEAIKEIKAEPEYQGTKSITDDAAIRLMIHQLAHICHVFNIENDGGQIYHDLTKICETYSG